MKENPGFCILSSGKTLNLMFSNENLLVFLLHGSPGKAKNNS